MMVNATEEPLPHVMNMLLDLSVHRLLNRVEPSYVYQHGCVVATLTSDSTHGTREDKCVDSLNERRW